MNEDRQQQVKEMIDILYEGLKPLKETYTIEEIANILYDNNYRRVSDWVETIKASKCEKCVNTAKCKCWKCVNEVRCKANGIYKSNCKDYKRDSPDGGYYG